MKYNIFGSHDSIDLDVMVLVDQLPISKIECAKLCEFYDSEFSKIYPNKKINSNICVIQDGIVIDCYKGDQDETNNMLIYTYHLHKQEFSPIVHRVVERDIELKIHRVYRTVLSFLSRHEDLRESIKFALRSSFKERYKVHCELIDFNHYIGLNLKNKFSTIEYFKTVAFQYGQLLGLFEKVELYTKKDIAENYPNLRSYLYRENSDGNNLNFYKNITDKFVFKHYYDMMKDQKEFVKF